jgi:DNA-directed RNA polymerase specialized sigma subunit
MLSKKYKKNMKEIESMLPLNSENGKENYYAVDESYKRVISKIELIDMIRKLKNPKERLVLILYKIRDYSVTKMAKILKTTEANIYTICTRAIINLRNNV